MKTIDDLGLCKKSRKKVEDWLQEWLDLFIRQANGKQGWPYRADFENKDNVKSPIFFFTDCKDILEKDPEARGQENNLAIRSRKRKILMQLFVKTLLGRKNICDSIKCGHCGFSPCWIEALGDGNGHWTYCPKCKKTEVQVFPGGYDDCMNTIKSEIYKRENKTQLFVHPYYRKLAEEIRAYKYEKGKQCPKCQHLMNEMLVYLDTSLTPVDGYHCPSCMYQMAKRKVPKGAGSTKIKGGKE